MRKRAAALVLCLLLMLQITAPSVRAEQSVYFVAVGSNVLPLTDATMPFWSGGYLYISSSIFTGVVWSAVGISHVPANARQPLILYSGEDRSLIFNLDKPYAEDPQGNTYYPGAVVRNGNVFVPASVVARYFGLQYSLIPNVEHGYLVWLRQPGYGLSDEEFATAATYPMASSYAQYLKSKESAQQTTPTPSVPEQDEEETPAVNGKNVYLCLKAGENTAQLLDVLDSAGEKASFFCSLEFLWTQGDLLRRMSASGHTVGILVDGEDSRSVTQQLHEGNEALWRAACTKTRLAYLENGDSADLQAAQEDGFRCIYPDLDRGSYSLSGTAQAEALLERITARRGSVMVWLGENVSAGGLNAFLDLAQEAEDRCLAVTETT